MASMQEQTEIAAPPATPLAFGIGERGVGHHLPCASNSHSKFKAAPMTEAGAVRIGPVTVARSVGTSGAGECAQVNNRPLKLRYKRDKRSLSPFARELTCNFIYRD